MSNTIVPNHERKHAPLERPLDDLANSFERFFKNQSSTGLLSVFCASAALILANSNYQPLYEALTHIPVGFYVNQFAIEHSLHHWVNDGLMVLFFFILGLEIKHEFLAGDLRDIRQSTLVLFMAAGGMVFPALIYAAFTFDGPGISGWGIPMATDTAFALGALAALGSRVPRSAAVILSALAIVDDIGAVMVIGIFYTEQLNYYALLNGALTLSALFLLNALGIRKPFFYLVGGIVLWWFVQRSGIHPTTAGILAALCVPARPYADTSWFSRRVRTLLRRFDKLDHPDQSILEEHRQHKIVEEIHEVAEQTTTPLQHWANRLDKPVVLIIVPLFAFLNAGVILPSDVASTLDAPILHGTIAGFIIGKGLGISIFAFIALRFGLAKLPIGMHFGHIVGLGFLAGMGFTMSLFIATLAFEGQSTLLAQAKIGVLSASAVALVVGVVALLRTHRHH